MRVYQNGNWIEIPDNEKDREAAGVFKDTDGLWKVEIKALNISEDILAIEEIESGKYVYVRQDIEEETNKIIISAKGK